MDTRHHGKGTRGSATLHVALAALGMVALLAMLAWSAWANTVPEAGVRCRAEGGRMTWSGCAMPQASKINPDKRSAAAR